MRPCRSTLGRVTLARPPHRGWGEYHTGGIDSAPHYAAVVPGETNAITGGPLPGNSYGEPHRVFSEQALW